MCSDQLCWDVGFPNTPQLLPRYVSGEDPIIIENYPEIAFYRDIVFYFKYLMLAPHENLPEPKAYMPIDAKLVWKYVCCYLLSAVCCLLSAMLWALHALSR